MYLQSHCFRTYTPTTTDYHTTTTTPYITSTSSTSSTTAYTTDSDLHKGDDITYTPTQTSYTSTTSSTSSTSTTTAYPLTGQPGPAPIPAGNSDKSFIFLQNLHVSRLLKILPNLSVFAFPSSTHNSKVVKMSDLVNCAYYCMALFQMTI